MKKEFIVVRRRRSLTIRLGEVLSHELAVARARLESRAAWQVIEKVAAKVGANLANPDEFRICQELAASK